MRLTVFNGSPRGRSSNTRRLLGFFLEGFSRIPGNEFEITYLVDRRPDEALKRFRQAKHVLIAFPLYFDAMPAMVKDFIESLAPLRKRASNPSLGFIVQSGFIEPTHSRAVKRYLAKLARRLGCPYRGTVIKGGGEAVRIVSLRQNLLGKAIFWLAGKTDIGGFGHLLSTDKLKQMFFELGQSFGRTGHFDPALVARLARPEKLNRFHFWLAKTVVERFYWNRLLKKNKAFSKRFDRPFAG